MAQHLICETPDAVAETCRQLKYQYQYVEDFHMEYFVCHVMQEGINLLQLVLRNIYTFWRVIMHIYLSVVKLFPVMQKYSYSWM